MSSSVTKLFGLEGEAWMRHANPVSVWTRFAVLPLLFPPPRSTRHWASKGVFGERIWTDRGTVELPAQFRSRVVYATYACQLVGMAVLAYGLVVLDLLAVVSGMVIAQTAKAWFIDRMVLLYEDMKTRRPGYADWER
jgi:hypothetical protein